MKNSNNVKKQYVKMLCRSVLMGVVVEILVVEKLLNSQNQKL